MELTHENYLQLKKQKLTRAQIAEKFCQAIEKLDKLIFWKDDGIVHATRNSGQTCLYGSGPAKVAQAVNEALLEQSLKTGEAFIPCTKEKAEEYIHIYFTRFPRLKTWIKECHNQILNHGFIYSHFGRKRRLRNITSSDRGVIGEELRSGFNAIIQGASSDILLLGGIDADEEIEAKGLDARILCLVHDSVVAEVHESCVEEYLEIVVRNIQKDRGLSIPGAPMGVDSDSESGGSFDYSCGKLEKQYPSVAAL